MGETGEAGEAGMSARKSDHEDFRTIRDYLRWAVTRFNAADLAYGQGTETALDDAAFLILETLNLPVDQLDPFLDARLSGPERRAVADIIEQRLTTRRPAAYLTGVAYIQGMRFRIDERALIPRSFVGELLAEGALGPDGAGLLDPVRIKAVADLGTGSGCLAILAAAAFPLAKVDAIDLSADALELAALNVAEHGVGDRVRLRRGDLFVPVPRRRYDLIIANPPYVGTEAMDRLPPEFRHEPAGALAGGPDGLDIVRRILAEAGDHLRPGGGLLCEIGTGRAILEAERPDLDFLWLDTAGSSGEVFWLAAEALVSQSRTPPGR